MTIKNRITQLEKKQNEQPANTPQVIEILGTREDGTQYLIERREKFIEEGQEVWRTVSHEQH